MYGFISINYPPADRAAWRERMAAALETATRFTIGCWNEETDAIALALRYGEPEPGDWAYGVHISGAVTDGLRSLLLDQLSNEPDQLTPFFSITLDNGAESSHWGTEYYQCDWTEHDLTALETPAGTITVDWAGKHIPFSVGPNPYSPPCEGMTPADNVVIYIHTIRLPNEEVRLRFSGCRLTPDAGDDGTLAVTGIADGWAVGLGAFDPNDRAKMEQCLARGQREGEFIYDARNFREYTVDVSPEGDGFTFRLLTDRRGDILCFKAAWLPLGDRSAADCTAAVDFWVT